MLETLFGNFVLASCTLESIVQPIVGSSLLPYKSVTPWLEPKKPLCPEISLKVATMARGRNKYLKRDLRIRRDLSLGLANFICPLIKIESEYLTATKRGSVTNCRPASFSRLGKYSGTFYSTLSFLIVRFIVQKSRIFEYTGRSADKMNCT